MSDPGGSVAPLAPPAPALPTWDDAFAKFNEPPDNAAAPAPAEAAPPPWASAKTPKDWEAALNARVPKPPASAPTAALPTWDDAEKAYDTQLATPAPAGLDAPVMGAAAEAFLSHPDNPVMHVLNAFGEGVAQGWGAEPLGADVDEFLRKSGIGPDLQTGQSNILKSFNEAIIRPAAIALTAALRAGSAAIGGITSAGAQAATEIGGPEFGRGVGGVLESVAADIGSGSFHRSEPPELITAARDANVIGTKDAVWDGREEPPALPEITVRPPANDTEASPSPEAAAPPTAPAEPLPPPADIHAAARQVDPVTFHEFDELAAQRELLRTTLQTQGDALREAAEAQAPGAAEVADLERRLDQGTTTRLAKKYQARLDELRPAHDAFLDDEFTMGALTRETPEMQQTRAALQMADYRMRDLAPDVSAAYREAATQFPDLVERPEPAAAPVAETAATPPIGETAAPIEISSGNVRGEAPIQRFTRDAQAINEALPPVQEGMTRLWRGNRDGEIGSAQQFTNSLPGIALPFREMYGGDVSYVDVPTPDLQKYENKAGAAPGAEFFVPSDVAAQAKPVRTRPVSRQSDTLGGSSGPPTTSGVTPGLKSDTPPIDIVADVSSKLQGAGRPADEADAAGALIKAHYEARAADFGGAKGTAEDLYRAEGPDIRWAEKGGRSGAASGKVRLRQRELAQGDSGRATAFAPRPIITLFSKADASTFIHETGHQWLEEMMRDADDERAPDALKDRAQKVHDWLGSKSGDAITGRQHEKFARGFEQYMMEGRAPSAGLARVFEQFKGWLTKIYETLSGLGRPISNDIRDVFDRLLTNNPDAREPVIAPEREFVTDRGARNGEKGEPAVPRIPKEPERLASFIRRIGGLRDEGGDIKHSIGGAKYRPGLIRRDGMGLDDAVLKAWEEGYFPEHGENRPSINDFLDAMRDDLNGRPRYSRDDQIALDRYHQAIERNTEVDRLAHEHGIDPLGMTRDQFFDEVRKRISAKDAEAYADSQDREAALASHEAQDIEEAYSDEYGEPTEPGAAYGEPRTLEDLEREHGPQGNFAPPQQRGSEDAGHETAGRGEGPVSPGEGQGGRGARDGGRERPGGGEGAGAGADGAAGTGAAAGAPESLPAIEGDHTAKDFRKKAAGAQKGDEELLKAANIRLDKINTTDDMNDALRKIASENGDFMDARYGTPAYQTQMEIRSTRVLLRAATSDVMVAAEKAAAGDEAAIRDYVTKASRAGMVFRKLSTMTADWAHAGHELNRVMDGWDTAKSIAAQVEDLTGKTLFQIQESAALMSRMTGPEIAGKLASELQMTGWELNRQRLISYFINNLISGPITHMAYSIGNTTFALFRAIPETAVQAAIGAVRGGEDRVYFGEIGAQVYGMARGARDGIVPAMEAIKSGVPVLPGATQGELGLGALNVRPQVLPGRIGYVLETPSRVVSGIHTLFYTMAYSQEIARLAFRDAASRGLTGNDFNVAVARSTASPTPEMMEAAEGVALRGVLMKRPEYGSTQQKLSALINSSTPLKLIAPFMQVGMNILEEGIVQRTPLAMLQSEARAEVMGRRGGAARDIRLGQIATGSMIGAAVVGMTAEGLMTGGGPSDTKVRRVMEAAGWKAYSIRFGDTYIPYRKFIGPLGPLLATAADFAEIGHTMADEGITKAAAALGMGFAEVVADETWMAGISNFVNAVQHWDTAGEQYIRNLATSFMPFSVGTSQVARQVDPYQRVARSLLDEAKNKLPFLSETLEPQIDVFGNRIASHSMVGPSTATNDPVAARLVALDHGIAPPDRTVRGVRLTDRQYTEYSVASGQLLHRMLTSMISTPGFSALPDGTQIREIDKAISASREAGRSAVMMRNPEIIRQAVTNKQTLAATGHRPN